MNTAGALRACNRSFVLLAILFIAVSSVANSNAQSPAGDAMSTAQKSGQQSAKTPPPGFVLTSTEFANGEMIPKRFTCDAQNISPLLSWTEPPDGTQALALIMDDTDAPRGDFVHWLIYDIPEGTSGLPDNLPPLPELQTGARQGMNDFHQFGYAGPCPPKGKTHRYFFRLYALSAPTGLLPGATKADVLRAVAAHTLAKAELMGRYQRQ